MSSSTKFIPALSFHWLTPFYDPLFKWAMREDVFKRHMIQQAQITPGMRVMDLGSGTGTLTIMIKQTKPNTDVIGIDADPQILNIARFKASQAGVRIQFEQGMANHLPYLENSFDRVLSCLVFHHLTTNHKRQALIEIYRVLKSGGELHILDFGVPHGTYARLISPLMSRLEQTADNILGCIPGMISNAGFNRIVETARYRSIFGSLSLYQAVK
ncbi:MAG: hypothetical protein A2029_16865 [Chloroflexi bacterium RBG_19FT_COMBO_47_9]|nr:MAG: hypothetical protein A2029_16865 [Chloroflexi bacterium RBG_19FT_COMBO_47_9]